MWEVAPEIFPTKSTKNLEEAYKKLLESAGNCFLTVDNNTNKVANINSVNISDGDTIVITFDMNKCDIEEAQQMFKMYQEAFPNNNIVAQTFPYVKSLEVLHRVEREDYPF